MEKHKMSKSIAGILATVLILFCSGLPVLASETIDMERETSLTVIFEEGGKGISDVEFSLYRVADLSGSGDYQLYGDFKEYPVSLEQLDSNGWRTLAQTLDGYVSRDGISCEKTARTDGSGWAEFSSLSSGLYLVMGERKESGDFIYVPESFLVSLPGYDQENRMGDHVISSCKFDKFKRSQTTISLKVLKVWKDDGNEDKRPENIRVQLLRDGEIFDTVTLSEENSWRYQWENLDSDVRWQVTEAQTPKGYTVSVEQEGTTFVMTNSSSSSNSSSSLEQPEVSAPSDGHRLPQTGMLWWPVPLLIVAGLLVYFAGWWISKDDEKKDD